MKINPNLDKRYIEGVKGVLQANSFEWLMLWRDGQADGKEIKMESMGIGFHVGTTDVIENDVTISFNTFISINVAYNQHGVKFIVIDPQSYIVDYRLIDQFMYHYFPALRLENAMNFHCINNLKN